MDGMNLNRGTNLFEGDLGIINEETNVTPMKMDYMAQSKKPSANQNKNPPTPISNSSNVTFGGELSPSLSFNKNNLPPTNAKEEAKNEILSPVIPTSNLNQSNANKNFNSNEKSLQIPQANQNAVNKPPELNIDFNS